MSCRTEEDRRKRTPVDDAKRQSIARLLRQNERLGWRKWSMKHMISTHGCSGETVRRIAQQLKENNRELQPRHYRRPGAPELINGAHKKALMDHLRMEQNKDMSLTQIAKWLKRGLGTDVCPATVSRHLKREGWLDKWGFWPHQRQFVRYDRLKGPNAGQQLADQQSENDVAGEPPQIPKASGSTAPATTLGNPYATEDEMHDQGGENTNEVSTERALVALRQLRNYEQRQSSKRRNKTFLDMLDKQEKVLLYEHR